MDKILYALNPGTKLSDIPDPEKIQFIITRAIGWGIPLAALGYVFFKIS